MLEYPLPEHSEEFFLQQNAQVYFRYPHSDRVHFWSENINRPEKNSEEVNERFYFAPFQLTAEKELYFKAHQKINWKVVDFVREVEDSIPGAAVHRMIKGSSNDLGERQRYLQLLQDALQELKSDALKKVVLSRQAIVEHQAHPLLLFTRALSRYRSAFCYLYTHPAKGCWLGASPEILIKKEKNKVETYSLAGTQKKNRELPPNWTSKELEEQGIVTEFIQEQLAPEVEHLIQDGPHDHAAGNLWHLRTVLKGQSQREAIPLVRLLHPSPAVCGMPREEAREYILKHEGYERSYYTGFLGPVQPDKASVFVNLRCMKLEHNRAFLYVGGGVTKESVPENEWEETCHKLQTMEQLFAE